MQDYIGSFKVDIHDTPFKEYTPLDWVEYFITSYSSFDGSHHKDWVLDQCMRICNGTEVRVEEARWGNGSTEYRVSLEDASEKYKKKILEFYDDGYEWDCGIAP